MPPSMPDILRQYRSDFVELWGDGSPVDDQGEAIFDAAMEYFGVDLATPEAGWELASKLLWHFLPGLHLDPKNKGGRPRTDTKQASALGARWHAMKTEARKNAPRARDVQIFRRNKLELERSSLLSNITVKRAIEKLNACERAYLADRGAELIRAWAFRKVGRSITA